MAIPEQPTPPSEPSDYVRKALEILYLGMISSDERRRIEAASGVMDYFLAAEIGELVGVIQQQMYFNLNKTEIQDAPVRGD